ncbi:MAG: flavin reductase [Halioglobus sp.]
MAAFDANAFRFALGNFATGVTVVTTQDNLGGNIGVTASSFNSVSLSPPLVLWSLDRSAHSLASFQQSEHFIVNVLSADQVELSNRFSRAGENKFVGLEYRQGVGGLPMLDGCSARFQCRTVHQYDGGDHIIFVGEVIEFDVTGRSGLVFHQGRYSVSADHPSSIRPNQDEAASGFVENFLPYMTGLCHQQSVARYQEAVAAGPLHDHQYRILFALRDLQDAGSDEISALTLLAPESIDWALSELLAGTLVCESEGNYRMTSSGAKQLEEMEQRVIACESSMLSVFSADESRQFKQQLARLIEWNR